MGKTSIEWTEETWNPVRGCEIVSPGCKNCYAMRQAHRHAGPTGAYAGLTRMTKRGPVWTGEVREVESLLDYPLRLRKPSLIFVNSMSDLFHEDVSDDFIARTFAVMAQATRHEFQILTKRAERAQRLLAGELPYDGPEWPLPNVWLGVSCEDQQRAEERIPALLATPAAVRWVSAEPLLGPLDLTAWLEKRFWFCTAQGRYSQVDWVVTGGESGPKARPMHPEWARSLRDQCERAGVPFLFKQWGAWTPYCSTPGAREIKLHGITLRRTTKLKAGRMLDGRTYEEYPHGRQA